MERSHGIKRRKLTSLNLNGKFLGARFSFSQLLKWYKHAENRLFGYFYLFLMDSSSMSSNVMVDSAISVVSSKIFQWSKALTIVLEPAYER